MKMNALRGIVKDGAGTTLYNYFTEFGLAQISVDFVLGTAGTRSSCFLPASAGKAPSHRSNRHNNRPVAASGPNRSPCIDRTTGRHPLAWFRLRCARIRGR